VATWSASNLTSALSEGEMNDVPLRVPKTAELIVEKVRAQVLRGELKAGEMLPNEAELCETFGVSRPTLREAIRILESESLVEIARGVRGGARIVAPTEGAAARYFGRYLQYAGVPMVDVHEATMAIELPAVASLARNRTAGDLKTLATLLDEERRQYGNDGSEAVLAGNAFHRTIVDLSGNRTLAIMHGMMEEVIITAGRAIASTMQGQFVEEAQRFHRVHEEIVELIRRRDAVAAEKLWRRHLDAKIRLLMRMASSPREYL
jgi:DNA-binding FadR family transcriptional regulator